MTTLKNEIKSIWIDQIKTAKRMADNAILANPDDMGTCNFDSCLFQKEKAFTYAETVALFAECGLRVSKYGKGWFSVDELRGQANRNTRWHLALKNSLEEQGFKCSMYYQMD